MMGGPAPSHHELSQQGFRGQDFSRTLASQASSCNMRVLVHVEMAGSAWAPHMIWACSSMRTHARERV